MSHGLCTRASSATSERFFSLDFPCPDKVDGGQRVVMLNMLTGVEDGDC